MCECQLRFIPIKSESGKVVYVNTNRVICVTEDSDVFWTDMDGNTKSHKMVEIEGMAGNPGYIHEVLNC